MVAFAIPWMAMGIGALIGGLGAKQKGGNFLKGALQGAALGGITGGLGAQYGAAGSAGKGMFGWGTKMLPNFLAYSGITMGTEMLDQGDANKRQMERQRRWLDEEEERRMARLSKIAGYDVGDPQYFMTPNKYFSARGGYKTRPHYQLGGPTSMEDDPANAANIQPLQMDPGTMGPGQFMEDFDYMDEASLSPEIQKLYRAFLVANQATEEEVPVEMFMQLMQQQGGQQGEQQGAMMAAEGGSVMGKDEYDEELNRPHMFLGGGLGIAALLGGAGLLSKLFGKGGKSRRKEIKSTLKKEAPIFKVPRPILDDEDDLPVRGLLDNQLALGRAEGGDVNRPHMFLGGGLGLAALLGGAGLLGKIFGRKGRRKDVKAAVKKKPIFKMPGLKPGIPWDPDEEDGGLPRPSPYPEFPDKVYALLNRAKGGGIGDLDLRGGGASMGPGTGTSDDIPAMLSDGEFVVTSNAVTNLGGGDRMLGAQRMYRMMNQLDPASQTPAEMSNVGYA